MFSPTCSLIRGLFEKEKPQWIRTNAGMEESWSACLQTLEGHSDWVYSVTFSHDSKLLASASRDKTVKLWDTSNAQCLQTLHLEQVVSVKSFDFTNSYLSTNNGTIYLSPVSPVSDERLTENIPEIPRFQRHSISSDGTWITWNSENLLWLPPEYRPSILTVALSNICIGCASGRVLIFRM